MAVLAQVNGEQIETLPDGFLSEITRLLDSLDARPRPTHSPRGLANRGTLGDFTSIVCFQALVRGLEDVLGPEGTAVVLIRAGRLRGQMLVEDWGVGHLDLPTEKIGLLLNAALGQGGTRLCVVRGIRQERGVIFVDVAETICAAGLAQKENLRCSYTLGALWGVLESLLGGKFEARQVGNVRSGDPFDVFRFEPQGEPER